MASPRYTGITFVDNPILVPKYGIAGGASPTNAALDQMVSVGAKYVRFDYSSTGKDTTVQAAVSRGLEVYLILFGTDTNPRTDPGTFPTTVANLYKNAKKADGITPRLRWYEILNEPDINGWTPDVYAQFALNACNQIRAADPGAIIGVPGCWIGHADAALLPQEFAIKIVQYQVPFDIWSCHLFDGDPLDPYKYTGYQLCFPHGSWPAGYTVREILDAGGYSNVPLMSSESHAFFSAGATAQANRVTTYLNETMNPPTVIDQKLASVAYYTMVYSETGSLDSALLNSDGTIRSSWTAYRTWATAHP
jgi:hypothetical protein